MLRPALLSMVFAFVLSSCSDSTSPDAAVEGTWRLQTVNGLPLPFILPESGVDKLELTGETITLVRPRALTIVTTFRVTDGANVFPESIPDSGTYTVNGSTVVLTWASDGTTSTATVSGSTMTLDDIGLTFVYRRD